MESTQSQFTSAVLHAAFLLICFSVPMSVDVEPLAANMAFERWVQTRVVLKDRPAPRTVQLRVDHVDGFQPGAGQGTRLDRGAGPEWGNGVGKRSKAPLLGPRDRSSGEVVSERTRPETGNALNGEEGEGAVTSDKVVGDVTEGADGGGGGGHAAKTRPEGGSGTGGEGYGACGCMEAPIDGFGMGTGTGRIAGSRSLGLPLPEPQLERTPSTPQFIVPSIHAAKPVVSCKPCAAIIERIIRAHLREIRYCYEQSLQRNSRLEGELMLTLRIAKKGGVPTDVAAKSPMPADDLEACAQKRMSRWIFPELPHDAKANFPVRLSRM